MKIFTHYYELILKNAKSWVQNHLVGLFIFNLIVIILLLLHSIGYFDPFLTISANLIIFSSIVLSIFLLGVRTKTLFLISLIFLFVGLLFKVAHVDIWAERAGIYTFQTLLLGILMHIIDSYFGKN